MLRIDNVQASQASRQEEADVHTQLSLSIIELCAQIIELLISDGRIVHGSS